MNGQVLVVAIHGQPGQPVAFAEHQSARAAGSVQAQGLKVSIAGSGGVKAHSSGTADVSIMGSGDVEVAGGAKCNISKAGSGNVRCS